MQRQRGYSMVEILAAVIVIGILAGIAITVYNGSKDNGKDAAAKSALATALQTAKAVYASEETYANFHTTVYNNDTMGATFMTMPGENSLQVSSAWTTLSNWSVPMLAAATTSSNPNQIFELGWNQQIILCTKSKSTRSLCIVDSRIVGDPAGVTSWNLPVGTFYDKTGANGNPVSAWNNAFTNQKKSW